MQYFQRFPWIIKPPVFYRPQRSWGKVMFLQVCVILFTGGVPDQVHPPGPGTPPPDQAHPPRTRYTPPGTREIRSTRGRYASYWNAFLLFVLLLILFWFKALLMKCNKLVDLRLFVSKISRDSAIQISKVWINFTQFLVHSHLFEKPKSLKIIKRKWPGF